MKFKEPVLEQQFAERLHFKTRGLIQAFEKFSDEAGLPQVVITAISREPVFYKTAGIPAKKFSWHFVDCAADLRNRHYNPNEYASVLGWFHEKCRDSCWELYVEDHGTGPHIHVAYREFGLRKQYEANNKKENKNGTKNGN